MKYFKRTAAVVLSSMMLLTGCNIGGREIVLDINNSNGHTVLSVNKKKCNIKEAMIYLCNYKNLYGNEYGVDLLGTDDASDVEKYIKDVSIDEITRVYCMVSIAQEKEISLTDDESKAVEDAAQEYYKSLSDDEKDFMGVGKSDVESAYENYALAQKLYNSLIKDVDTEVSDDDARVIHIQKIFVTGQESADTVKQKIAAGEDFATIATSLSEDSQTDLYVAKGTLPEKVEQAAFDLNDGQISDMIQTDDGYYFIKCISKMDQEKTDQNKVNILQQREQDQFNEDYDGFVNDAQFELNSDLWEEISLSDAENINTDSFFSIYDKHFTSK